ncbi:hypothetical protein JW865_05920 [Candidatus Bathyarchaeota archaeon]|nr:hypothetical protein [Candidatus Bathyarchaeota archaeon]
MSSYIQKNSSELNSPTYLRKNSLEKIKKASAIIFDCDGVLIDIQNSYEKAVSTSVSKILFDLARVSVDSFEFENEVNFAFKNTGGFNNDWSLVYAFLIYLVSLLPESRISELNLVSGNSLIYKNPCERYSYIKNNMIQKKILNIKEVRRKLLDYALKLDSSGLNSVEKEIQIRDNFKKAINFPGKVGESIISTLFEQIFSGKELFEKNFGVKPCFETDNEEYIKYERTIATTNTLEKLSKHLGKLRLGIASGSFEKTAKFILKTRTKWFNPEAEVWMETVDAAIEKLGIENLHKPNPYSLFVSAKIFEPFEQILYVGDTKADLIMVERANELDPRYLFVGVYGDLIKGRTIRDVFLESGSDVVLPSINDLPEIIEDLRREKI